MRLVLAVIVTACAIAVLIDCPRRELAAQLRRDWQEYRDHVGITALQPTSENLADSFQSRLDTKR